MMRRLKRKRWSKQIEVKNKHNAVLSFFLSFNISGEHIATEHPYVISKTLIM